MTLLLTKSHRLISYRWN